MPRAYKQQVRAERTAETRARILAAALATLPDANDLQMEEIARRAEVSIPTIYSHFGSRGGLLSALVGQVEKEAGLFTGLEVVWQSTDGESALRRMLEATFAFWHEAWTFVGFALRVRRSEAELESRLGRVDASRLGHLVVISRRLAEEGRLQPGLKPADAARLAFALSTPYVYEAMVIRGHLSTSATRRLVVEAIAQALLRPGTDPVSDPAADWLALGLKPPVTG
ncbi:MAG: hypothetical protein NVS9B1_27700 [Candidatus Dormibacteraceae bacterium]